MADDFPHLWRPLSAILIVILGAAAGKILGRLLASRTLRLSARFGTPATDGHARLLRRDCFATILLAGVYQALQILEMPDRAYRLSSGAAFGLCVLFAVLLARRLLALSLQWYAKGVASRTDAPIDTQFIPLLDKTATIFVFLTGAVIVLRAYGYDISTLVVSLGIGSLAIGLAMQQTLANMIAGFTIMLDRPFRIGDRVQLSSGEVGDVTEIGLRSTRIRTLDLTTLIIPNAQMVNERLLNHNFPDVRERPLMTVNVAYGTDPARVKKVLEEVVAAEPLVDKDPAPAILLTGFGASALNFAVRFTVRDFHIAGEAVDAIGSAVQARFEEEGIVIHEPTRIVLTEAVAPLGSAAGGGPVAGRPRGGGAHEPGRRPIG
jgi:small-conductance mechanosensitive channel